MLSDIKRDLSRRSAFLIPKPASRSVPLSSWIRRVIIRFVMVTDLSVGRNPQEVLRVLDALQTDELCPCNWKKGEATLVV